MEDPIRILVSACLLGDPVRFDGGHKRSPFLTRVLDPYVEWVKVCPEVELGLGVPRESMRLVDHGHGVRLVASRSGEDRTDAMEAYARERLEDFAGLDLCGYVCKSRSPSSGMERVKVYDHNNVPRKVGAGVFTRMFTERYPLVPVEEEGRLHDPLLREMFVERVFCMKRWRDLVAGGRTRGRLVDFHTNHKLLLLSHGRVDYTALGRLVAAAKDLPVEELYDRYFEIFVRALSRRATTKLNTDVLQHMMGHLRQHLSADEKQELLEVIGRYHRRLVPLVVPITLFQHYVRKYGVEYLARQVFLAPHPVELMLRNHV